MLHLYHQIVDVEINRYTKAQLDEASCFPRFRIQTESGISQAFDFVLDPDQVPSYRGLQTEPWQGPLSITEDAVPRIQ